MKVEDLFSKLSYGELSNLNIGNEGRGSIQDTAHLKLIGYADEGLLSLYGRFILRESDLIIETRKHITNYHLLEQFAENSGSNEPYPYIKDLPGEKFKNDVIKILTVYDMHGNQLPLNDVDNRFSLFTPMPQTLQVPRPLDGVGYSIGYQARHLPLVQDPDELLDQEIILPFVLERALQFYIAAKVYSHINGQENQAKSIEHMQSYEGVCIEVQSNDLVSQSFSTSHHKLNDRGFV